MAELRYYAELEENIYTFLNEFHKRDTKFYTKTYVTKDEWISYQQYPNIPNSILQILSLKHYEINFSETFTNDKMYITVKCNLLTNIKPPSYYAIMNVLNRLDTAVKIYSVEDIKYLCDCILKYVSINIELVRDFVEQKCQANNIEILGYPNGKRHHEIPFANLTCERVSLLLPSPVKLYEPEIDFIKRINGNIRLIYNSKMLDFPKETLKQISYLPNVKYLYIKDVSTLNLHSYTYLLDQYNDTLNLRRIYRYFHKSKDINHPLANRDILYLIESFLYQK